MSVLWALRNPRKAAVKNNVERLYCLPVGHLERNQHNIKLYEYWAIDISEAFRCQDQGTVGISKALKLLQGE